MAGTKGPLVQEHILIASIEHYKSLPELPQETENEINLYVFFFWFKRFYIFASLLF